MSFMFDHFVIDAEYLLNFFKCEIAFYLKMKLMLFKKKYFHEIMTNLYITIQFKTDLMKNIFVSVPCFL